MAAVEEPHAAGACDFSRENVVTIICCDPRKKLIVHGTYLIRVSEYFKAALKKEWIEGQSRTIELLDEIPEAMAHYLTYIYSGKLATQDNCLKTTHDFRRDYKSLAKL